MLKNKTIFVMSTLAIAISLGACQPKQTEKQEDAPQTQVDQQKFELVGDNEKLSLNLPECKDKNCPELDIERLNTNHKFIDQVIDQKILEILKEVVTLAPNQEKEATSASVAQVSSEVSVKDVQTPKMLLEQKVAPYTKSFLSLDAEIKALSANHSINLMIKPKILNSEGPLATVVLNSSHYLGGAHGSSSQTYFNFDLETNKQVKLSDIVEKDKLKELDAKAYEAFKAWVIESEIATNVEEYEQAWKFKLSDNFNLGKKGLILQYAEYEIGPYVVGLPRLVIPYEQLNGIIKARYLPELSSKPVSAASEVVAKETK
ncbi:hypothetical protein A6M14_01330 [Acinetobacter sp. Ac_877]|uniref:RsiV family protein n=1 Tax=Acinetobacter portensis TaxID=1839785 RepID=UPI00128C0582|nr:RsiV family protein [Acinetobacter portensis]MPW41933.1 hypothetical protein [Acinetobacter portensis]